MVLVAFGIGIFLGTFVVIFRGILPDVSGSRQNSYQIKTRANGKHRVYRP